MAQRWEKNELARSCTLGPRTGACSLHVHYAVTLRDAVINFHVNAHTYVHSHINAATDSDANAHTYTHSHVNAAADSDG